MLREVREAVRKLLGVEDAPEWLLRRIVQEMRERGLDVEGAVSYLAPLIERVYGSNVRRYRPGRASIRKASVFLTAEMLEMLGYRVEFIRLFGTAVPAAVKGEGVYTPAIPVFDSKRRTRYIAALSRKLMRSVIQITTVRGAEGVLAEVVRVDRPPFYYLYTPADLRPLLEGALPIQAQRDSALNKLYQYWKLFRERGYLVLVGREIGGVVVDLLAVGLGRYAVVRGAGGRKLARLRRVLDGIYVV
jgi:hypothetical protein